MPLPLKSNTVAPYPTFPPTVLIPIPEIDTPQSVFPLLSNNCNTCPGDPKLSGKVTV
jgi:hypothetical protein